MSHTRIFQQLPDTKRDQGYFSPLNPIGKVMVATHVSEPNAPSPNGPEPLSGLLCADRSWRVADALPLRLLL
ncbi:BQ5605_C005g03289 [Microbotryum silenes-dioicae]|uniref:BQ5605_C005g03289 protein n=1 Tax=Microbotryum silenes-dioicae TaxID=796604 RepID=A0A2X0MEE9_9BASI|nr:BQ5605_C005g03289 [Microbotryum silenes-dioicae]